MLKMLTLSNINNLKCEKYKAFEIVISLNQHVIILRCLCKPCDKNTKIAKTRNNGSTKLPENKKNGNRKSLLINNYYKYKWIKISNKRHKMAECRKKQDPMMCCLQETHFSLKDTHRLRVKG